MPVKNPTPEQRAEWEAGRQRKRRSISLTDEEYEMIQRAAAKLGLTVSGMIAEWARRSAKRRK